jgi:uncharacterized protein
MSTAFLQFHGELASLAGSGRRDYPVPRRASLKDVIEARGVPHTEVYALSVDGQAADFGHILAPREAIDVFPGHEPVDVTAQHALRPSLPALRFVADANVGRLATYLRLMGFDVAYDHRYPDAEVAEISASQSRVVLTRDRGLLRRKAVEWGRLVRSNDPLEQTRDIVRFFGLAGQAIPFTRCVRCNVELLGVSKAEVLPLLQPRTKKYYQEFFRCPSCERVYWAGSHHERMEEMLARLTQGERDIPLPGRKTIRRTRP